MSFLSPWFIAGLVAVSLPILFHLIRQTPHGRVPFSTLMFLKPSPPRVTRRSRLDHWLLLFLRALAICLLALAFARPFLRTAAGVDISTDQGKRIAILLDTSASMRRDGLWEASVARANEVIAEADSTDRIGVFTFDRRLTTVIGFEEWSQLEPAARHEVVENRLSDREPGWAATDLGQALLSAAEILAAMENQDDSGRHLGPKQVVVISDLQAGSRLHAIQVNSWPEDIQVRLEPMRVDETTNAGLQLVADNPSLFSEDEGYQPRVRVINAADSTREQFRLRWNTPDQGNGSHQSVDVYVPPGESRVVRAPVAPQAARPGRLVLEGDSHDFDNTIYVERPIRRTFTIVYYGSESADDSQGLRYYFERAFPERLTREVEILAQDLDAPPLSPANLDIHLAVVTTEILSENHIRPLRQYVERGGTLVHVLRSPTGCETLSHLLEIDADLLVANEAEGRDYAMFARIDFDHELFAPFADSRYADFTNIRFWKHRSLQIDPQLTARPLVRFDNGDPAVVELPLQRGRILLLTSGWNPEDSQWALSSKFAPWLNRILETSTPQSSHKARHMVGDAVPLPQSPSAGGAPASVRLPDASQIQLAGGEESFDQTVVPGVYTADTSEGPMRFIVDLDAEESKTAPMPIEQLEALGIRLDRPDREMTPAEQAARQRQLQARELEDRQKYWRWLILAALAVLLLETWLAGRYGRSRTAVLENAGSESP